MSQREEKFPVVSVIIITYNQQHCIDRAIAGVIHQRGKFNLELIVANDASTDSTIDHVREWQRRHPQKIKVIDHPTNIGFRANYLSGFKAATGDYLCMCDADDYWADRNKIKRQMEWMESHPECAITFHRVINLYLPSRVKTLSNGSQKTDTTIVDLSRSNYITNLSVMYRRKLVDKDNLPSWLAETSLPDYAYHMLYAAHGSIHYINRAMGVYVQSSSGAWSLSGEMKRLEMALDVRERLMDYLGKESPAYEGLRSASNNILIAMLLLSIDNGDSEKERKIRARLADAGLNDSEDINVALSRRRALLAKRTNPLKQIVRQTYRQLTRLLPTPKPC